jgi:hypothetical protein
MGAISSAAISQTLTNYAAGLAQDTKNALANFFAPSVHVATSIGKYKQFSDKNAFQNVNTSRAIGGTARRIEFSAADANYNCQPQALEITIDDAERQAAGEGGDYDIEKAKIDTLFSTAVVSHEAKAFSVIAAGVTAVAGAGIWSDPDVDPITEIDQQIQAIAVETGMMPNRVGIGLGAWSVLRDHPKVIARQPGAQLIGLSTKQLSSMLMNPEIDVRVGIISKDTKNFGNTKSASNIIGSEVYVFIGSETPSLYDPSFAKTFRTRNGGVDAVRMYRSENNRSDVIALDWSEDIQIVSTAAVRRITLS